MLSLVRAYIRFVDGMNRAIGRAAMFLIFGMMAVLMYSVISKNFFEPSLMTLEIAQESETKAKVVQIFKDYNEVMEKAGRPYRYS